jgi:hypothetical protein
MTNSTATLRILIVLAAFLGGCASLGAGPFDSAPEITFDGLERLRGAQVDRLWVRPGASLEGKTQIMPQFAGFSYRSERTGHREGYKLTNDQHKDLEEALHKVFLEELTRGGDWQVTQEPGPDVILVRAWLADMVVRLPPDTRSGRGNDWVASAGEATLVVEVYDAETRQILVRAADRAAVQRAGGGMMRTTSGTNRAEVRRMFRSWAQRLRRGLDEVKAEGTFEIY